MVPEFFGCVLFDITGIRRHYDVGISNAVFDQCERVGGSDIDSANCQQHGKRQQQRNRFCESFL